MIIGSCIISLLECKVKTSYESFFNISIDEGLILCAIKIWHLTYSLRHVYPEIIYIEDISITSLKVGFKKQLFDVEVADEKSFFM